MRKKTPRRAPRATPLLPRRKKERRRVELLGAAAITLFAVLIVAAFMASDLVQPALRFSNTAAVVSAVLVDLANNDRTQDGLGTLALSPLLVEAAQAKANDMAEKSYFAHTSPQGIDPWFWFQQVGYKFDYAGENLAVNFSDSGDVNNAWMNSPEHRANILDPHFTQIGIATAQGMYEGQMVTFVVQEFGTPAPQQAAQEPVAEQTIPSAPTQPALAAATRSAQVLGTTVDVQKTTPPAPSAKGSAATSPANAAVTTSPIVAASLAKNIDGHVPWWGYLVAFPRDALRDAYLFFGTVILAALVYETGLEVHRKHAKKALAVTLLLAVMCGLFVLANYFFFAQPVLALTGASF